MKRIHRKFCHLLAHSFAVACLWGVALIPILFATQMGALELKSNNFTLVLDTNLQIQLTRTPIILTNGNEILALSFFSDSNHNYVVEFRDDIGFDLCNQWQPLTNAPHNYGIVFTESGVTNRFYRLRRIESPRAPLFALLANDTGTNSLDGITSDPTITGLALEFPKDAVLRGSLDSTNGVWTSIATLGVPQHFLITREQLSQIAGGNLQDGAHTLYLRADGGGILYEQNLSFVLDSTAPTATLDLAPEFDSSPFKDHRTVANPVTLIGHTEPGQIVELLPIGLQVKANANGDFAFSSLTLARGTNHFWLHALDAACNEMLIDYPIVWVGPADECTFDGTFTSWQLKIGDAGLADSVVEPEKGAILYRDDCAALMKEGDSFLVTLSRDLDLPSVSSQLSFRFSWDSIDTTSANRIRDAFEVALLDESGRPMTYTVSEGRDVFMNAGELASPLLAKDARLTSSANGENTVSIQLDPTALGKRAKIVFRLINNDQDRQTAVRLSGLSMKANESGVVVAKSVSKSSSPIQNMQRVQSSSVHAGLGIRKTAHPLRIQSSLPPPIGQLGGSVGVFYPLDQSHVPGNTSVLISGNIHSSESNNSQAIWRGFITLNGTRAEAVDAAGNFFSHITIKPGTNLVEIRALDTEGNIKRSALTLIGDELSTQQFDLTELSDVSASIAAEYGRTSFDEHSHTLFAEIALRNAGQYPIRGPLVFGIRNLSDATIRILNSDGLTTDGSPFKVISGSENSGASLILKPGETSRGDTIAFLVPAERQFIYDLLALGRINRDPIISSIPVVETVAGVPYVYRVVAVDPDSDTLSFVMTTSPSGMSIDPVSGVISWNPDSKAIGTHLISVTAKDNQGGLAEQHFVLTVVPPQPNRPPVIESSAITSVRYGSSYRYAVQAHDADGDRLTYSLSVAPSGMAINETSGLITWRPGSTDIRTHIVTLQVSDGNGGITPQTYTLSVLPDPGNHPPIIISSPSLSTPRGRRYTYRFEALDPDNDPLTLSGSHLPSCSSFNPATGEFVWDVPKRIDFLFPLGETGRIQADGIAMDKECNTYVTGTFLSNDVDFDPGPGVKLGVGDHFNAYVAKYTPTGELIWVHQFNSLDAEVASYSLALHDNGDIVVTGFFRGATVFDSRPGGTQLEASLIDVFVARLNSRGELQWAIQLGGAGRDQPGYANSLAVDRSGNTYVTGFFTDSGNFGPFNLHTGGNKDSVDPFVAKLDPQGRVLWARNIGIDDSTKHAENVAEGVFVDGKGNVYFCGHFNGVSDFDPGEGVYHLTSNGSDVFVVKLNDLGNFLWAHKLGGAGSEISQGLAIDTEDELILTGTYDRDLLFDERHDLPSLTNNSETRGFVVKLSQMGDLRWMRQIAGVGSAGGPYEVATDLRNNIFVTGVFSGTLDPDPGHDEHKQESHSIRDFFTASYDAGGAFRWVTRAGGTTLAVNDAGTVAVAGYFDGNFQNSLGIGIGDFETNYFAERNITRAFVTKFNIVDKQPLGFSADDGRGGVAVQEFVLSLDNYTNHPPVIISQPLTNASPGLLYSYDVEAIDEDLDPLTYSLLQSPQNMVINPTSGVIQWTPSKVDSADVPFAPAFQVSAYAFLTNPIGLAFAPDGTLYVGMDQGGLPISDPNERIRRVEAGGRTVSTFGNAIINDPDAVAYDSTGILTGVPGSLLVGGEKAGNTSLNYGSVITAVYPDGTITNEFELGREFSNPNKFLIDHDGKLLFMAYAGGNEGDLTVYSYDGTNKPRKITSGNAIRSHSFSIDSAGRIYVVDWQDKKVVADNSDDLWQVSVFSPAGVLLKSNFVANLPIAQRLPSATATNEYQSTTLLASSPASACYPEFIYLLHNGDLTRYTLDGKGELVASGFGAQASDMVVGPDNALYVSMNNGASRILRLLPDSCAQVTVQVADEYGGKDTQEFLVHVADPTGFGAISGNVFQDTEGTGTLYRTVFNDAFEGGLAKWVGKGLGSHSGLIVQDPLYETNHVLTFAHAEGSGDVFSGPFLIPRGAMFELEFDYLGLVGSDDRGGFIGLAQNTPGRHGWLAGSDSASGGGNILIDDGEWHHYQFRIVDLPKLIDVQTGTAELRLDNASFDQKSSINIDTFLAYLGVQSDYYRVTVEDFVGQGSDAFFDNISARISTPGLAQRIVYVDSNNNRQRDIDEPFAITDISGAYTLTNLASGFHSVVLEGADGWASTIPIHGVRAVEVVANTVVEGVDFGSVLADRPPTIASIPLTNASVGQIYRYDVQAYDADGDALTFDLPLKPIGMAIQTTTGVIVWEPTSEQQGSQAVILRVRDSHGNGTLQSFQIRVTDVNRAPVITSRPMGPASVGNLWQYQIRAQDADGDTIQYALAEHPTGMSIDTTNGLVTWSPLSSDLPEVQVTAAANDGKDSVAQTFKLSVVALAENHQPQITSHPSASIQLRETFLYRLEAVDPDGDPLSFAIVSGPSGLYLGPTPDGDLNARLLVWAPAVSQKGSNGVKLIVTDGRGGATTQSFSALVVDQVENNHPEISSTPNFSATVGSAYEYNPIGTDPDNDPLIWILETHPSGMSIDPTIGFIRWTPSVSELGTNRVALRLLDARGAFAIQTFEVIVRPANSPPQFLSVPPTVAALGQLYEYQVTVSDLDHDFVNYLIQSGPAGLEFVFLNPDNSIGASNRFTTDMGSALIRWTPSGDQLGTNHVTLRIDDGSDEGSPQEFSIVVTTNLNHPPIILSSAPTYALVNQVYSYSVQGADPDGDALHYVLVEAPRGAVINATNGLLNWVPSTDQVDVYRVTIAAVDPQGAQGMESYSVTVTASNFPPILQAIPTQLASVGAIHRQDIRASDPNGDPITYSVSGPAGILIDNKGRLTWAPIKANIGSNLVVVTVTDSHGASASIPFQIDVIGDDIPPFLQFTCPTNPQEYPEGFPLGNSYLDFTVHAVDNVSGKNVSVSVTVGGEKVVIDAQGRGSAFLNKAGLIPLIVTSTDAAGNSATQACVVTVIDYTGNGTAPHVSLFTPEEGSIISSPTNVIGSVIDDNLVSYELTARPFNGTNLIRLASGTSQVVSNVLGRFDPTLLANGDYVLRLSALDKDGFHSSIESSITVAGELKVGNFRLSFVDLSIPVNGIPITVARGYDTLQVSRRGDFGWGWRLEFRDTQLQTSMPPRSSDEVAVGLFQSFTDHTRVAITLPGGKREVFTFAPKPTLGSGFASVLGFFAPYTPSFTPFRGSTAQLSVPSGPQVVLFKNLNGGWDAANDGGLGRFPYNPDDPSIGGTYFVQTRDGIGYAIDPATGLMRSATDSNGNSLEFFDNGVTNIASGIGVSFIRNPRGLITAVTDPAGRQIRYSYDSEDNLVSVTDRGSNKVQFVYSSVRPHYLVEVIDALGHRAAAVGYDDSGRMTNVVDAANNSVQLLHDIDHSVERVIDALGYTNSFVYDGFGNVIYETNAMGGVTYREYDENFFTTLEVDSLGRTNRFRNDDQGNVLEHTDPLGNTTQNIYADVKGGFFAIRNGLPPFQRRLATTIDPLGNSIKSEYSELGELTASVDAKGNTTRYGYDQRGNQNGIIDALGNTTEFSYNGAGQLIEQKDVLGNITRFAYDLNGNQIEQSSVVTLAPGVVVTNLTRTTFDANGHPIEVVDPLGNTTRTFYDGVGNTIATVDALGHTNRFIYDDRGKLISTIFPDGGSNSIAYDPAGRRISSTDRAERITTYEYDPLGRVISTTFPDGSRSRTIYDLAGQVIEQIDSLNHRTTFAYDAAGRQTAITNALGSVSFSEFDSSGRKIKDIDPLGRVTRYVYDEIGRRMQTFFADGTSTSTFYDALGRSTIEQDQAGVRTAFGYDLLGRLTSVTNAMETPSQTVTTYSYNEAGQLLGQQDALGRVTRYEYDGLGRRVVTQLPLGQRSGTFYTPIGNVAATTNFNGQVITFEYDVNHRLVRKRLPDGTRVDYAYTPSGRRSEVAIFDAQRVQTRVWRFSYDNRDRLLSRIDPDGRSISYAYDLSGNRTSLTTWNPSLATSNTTAQSFDPLNRLETVTDSDGGVTRYSYDSAGNIQVMAMPNGTFRTNIYDSLNRVTNITHVGPSGVFLSLGYAMSPTGQRLSVQENNGRRVQYTYDLLNRLTRESITDATAGNRTIDYGMDDVGNRLTRFDSVEGRTDYTYDENDQLLTDTLGTIATHYTYDANGNTLSRSNHVEHAKYFWSAEKRLVAASVNGTNGAHLLAYQYDDDGIRVASSVDGDETRYLIDANRPYAQVVEEYAADGTIRAGYTVGHHHLISQTRGGTRAHFHADHLGTTRALTGPTGSLTDIYQFDAYGRALEHNGPTEIGYAYAGEKRDGNSGLDYLRARYLAYAAGRFISRDPFFGGLHDPHSRVAFSYVADNPINNSDPSGEVTLTEAITTVTIVGILTSVAPGVVNLFRRDGEGRGSYYPDAVVYGVAVSGSANAIANGTLLASAIGAAPAVSPSTVIAQALPNLREAAAALPLNVGVTVGAEIIANARTKEFFWWVYGGPQVNIEPNRTGDLGSYSISVYQSIIWNLSSRAEYTDQWTFGVSLGGELLAGFYVGGFSGRTYHGITYGYSFPTSEFSLSGSIITTTLRGPHDINNPALFQTALGGAFGPNGVLLRLRAQRFR